MSTQNVLSELPFVVSIKGMAVSLWEPVTTGVWGTDNEAGRNHADALIEVIRAHDAPPLLGQVVKALGRSGRWSGVEVGFTQRLAEWAVAGYGIAN